MTARADHHGEATGSADARRELSGGPFLHTGENIRHMCIATLRALAVLLAAGVALFGWRAATVAAICIISCLAVQRLCWRLTLRPWLGRPEDACLLGVLLALTLPAFVPWYVPLIASAVAVLLGAAPAGACGRGLWQGVLIAPIAVALLFGGEVTDPPTWPVLGEGRSVTGDILRVTVPQDERADDPAAAPHAVRLVPPRTVLAGLTRRDAPAYGGLLRSWGGAPTRAATALSSLPDPRDMILGSRPGLIGGTCAAMLIAVLVYLAYRRYVRGLMLVAMLAAAWCTAAAGPVWLLDPDGARRTVSLPLLTEGFDAGMIYCAAQLLSGEVLLAALLLAVLPAMRPLTGGGQVAFGAACGAAVMASQMYTTWGPAAFAALLGVETLAAGLAAAGRFRRGF